MMQEHFLTLSDEHSWKSHLPAHRSVFGSHGYAHICHTFRKLSPRLYVLQDGDTCIAYPMFLRTLANLPFAADVSAKWDATTPDYTGPLVTGDGALLHTDFEHRRDQVFREEGIVAEFAHLHPWGDFCQSAPDGLIYNREIVWVDLSLSLEELWSTHLEPAARKNVKRGEREGVVIRVGTVDEDYREFYRIYEMTMRRNQALPGYYFSYEFFRAFGHRLGENCRLALATYADQVIAATLFLYDDDDVYSFLGGADPEFQGFRPTNLLVWDTIQWARRAGKKRLILGGGYKPTDGIYRFKGTFSQLRRSFYVYNRIHLRDEYLTLDSLSRKHPGWNDETAGYFPSYRNVVLTSA